MGATETVRNVIGGDGSRRLLRSNGTVSDSHDVAEVGAVGRGVDAAIGGSRELYGLDNIERGWISAKFPPIITNKVRLRRISYKL